MDEPFRIAVSGNGTVFNFQAIPWCVIHDEPGIDTRGGGWICRDGFDTETPCDVRHDGTGNVWRFIPMGLEAYGMYFPKVAD